MWRSFIGVMTFFSTGGGMVGLDEAWDVHFEAPAKRRSASRLLLKLDRARTFASSRCAHIRSLQQ
jgi:hypothetical protein